ncbi:MAG: AAA family ATPase [Pseudomonadota bacterium]
MDTNTPLAVVLETAVRQIGQIVLGKEREIRLALACVLARGHLLIEDLPGMGKTTLAHALAQTLGLQFHRIQFTADLLPADILGVSVFDRERSEFVFHPGPIFAHLILADEVNRATPKAQSALLEAMEEHQVTTEGETRPLPAPFFVIATQNPMQQVGTFPLPESQLDRFLMRVALGYPDAQAERMLLAGEDRREMISHMQPLLDPASLIAAQQKAAGVFVAEALLDYVQALIARSRSGRFGTGLSPRAGLALVHASRAWAFLAGRAQVVPEDVQAVLPAVAGHRLRGPAGEADADALAQTLLASVAIP